MSRIVEHEAEQVEHANASGRTPVVFVHGLWLLPSSWDAWAELFEEAGYTAVQPGWPDDPETVEEAQAHPEVFAGKSIGDVADHFEAVIRNAGEEAGRDRALLRRSADGDPGRTRPRRRVGRDQPGPVPRRAAAADLGSSLGSPVLENPRNKHRAIPLTYEQFRYSFANAVDEDEAKQLYETYSVPGPGEPIFQAASANFNPWTEAKVDTKNPKRGPLLIVSGEKDHTVPAAIAKASYKKERKNEGVTEFATVPGRGHALTIDSGWRDVAEIALAFVKRFA